MSDLTEVPDLMGKLDAAIAVVRADEREKALADAKARIEDLHYAINQCPIRPDASSSVGSVKSDDNLLIGTGYQLAVNDALAALNQPQTEKMCRVCRNVGPPGYNCSECDGGGAATEKCPEDCDGFGQLIGDSDGPCPACSGLESDGGGAATAAGVADALTLTPGEARNLVDAAMGDEHDPQLLDSTVKRIGDEADRQLAEPGPYAKAFRERVCPVPEFPGIKNRQEDQA
jgi:hypothetical protein